MTTTLVLASNNAKKLAELHTLLAPLGLKLQTQGECGITEADEPYPSFVENALAKARHAAAQVSGPALADDSGLCVEALQGAPGVRSARFASDAGAGQGDAANNAHLLHCLRGVNALAQRRASFVCVLVALRAADDPAPLIASGRWSGLVLHEPRGLNGFGYDPLILIPSEGLSVAQLEPARKNALSHRAMALNALVEQMKQAPHWAPD